jgi:flagellar biogenesis protein FliO
MIDFEKQKMPIIIGVLIVIIGIYFAHTWHVNKLIDDKFRKIAKERKKKQIRLIKNKQLFEEAPESNSGKEYVKNDMDSYIDPNNGDDENMQ